SAQSDLPLLLEILVERAAELLHLPVISLMTMDNKLDELDIVVEKGGVMPVGRRIKVGHGVAGMVAKTRTPLLVPNYQNWEEGIPASQTRGIRAALGAPLIAGGA